jgi:hypothetical protein
MKKNKKLVIIFISILLTFCSVVAMASASETRYLGDVSGDGKVSATDARQVLRVAAMLDEFTPDKLILADTNEDGKITSSDARMVLRMAAMLEELIEIEDSTEDEGNEEITTKPLETETTTKTEETTTQPNESTTKPNETTTETEKPSYKNEIKLDETLP